MLLIGTDRSQRTHKVRDDAFQKHCGYKLAICGQEVQPTETEATSEAVDCRFCNHGYDLGEHLFAPFKEHKMPKSQ